MVELRKRKSGSLILRHSNGVYFPRTNPKLPCYYKGAFFVDLYYLLTLS